MTYLAPGVYTEEVASGPQPIAAAPTSVVAIVGTTQRGPVKEPRRITGWGQFLEVFGGTTDRGYTAESVFGFFENGGPAAYVVRVDPSIGAEWIVRDAGGNEAFRVTASSPGAWANDLAIAVAPDESGGNGQFYVGTVSGPANVTQNTDTAVPVDSSTGVQVGDTVVLLGAGGATATATVQAVTPTSITVNKATAGAFALVKGDRIATQAQANATIVRLAAANGIRDGDVITAQLPDRSRVSARVTKAVNQGAGMVLTLAAGLPGAVPGAQFAPRVDRFKGTIAGGSTSVGIGAVSWADDELVRPQPADVPSANFRAFAANGLVGNWQANRFVFAVAPPAGPIEVEATISVRRYTEKVALSSPALADLAVSFSFVPPDTTLRLTRTGGGTTDVTRTAGGFTVANAADLAHDFTDVEFRLPTDASKGVVVRCAREVRVGDTIEFSNANKLVVTAVTSPGGTIQVLDFADTTDISNSNGDRWVVWATEPTRVTPLRFSLIVSRGGAIVERYPSLGLDVTHPFYYFRDDQINGRSATIRVTERDTGNAVDAGDLPSAIEVSRAGADGVAKPADFRAGFNTLEAEPEPAMVMCPETTRLTDPLLAADVVGAMVTHCEEFKRLAIVDAPSLADDQAIVAWRNTTVSSTYAAVYAPFVKIVSLADNPVEVFSLVPPSGFVAGVMARVDRTPPGVAKAPANEQVSGIVGLSQTYTLRRQELLNPASVNVLRAFPGRGIRVWGARNATDDTTWRYVNVRRLFNAIETSIERGTQWVVFEPNTAVTWLRVKVSVEGFLEQAWRAGELAGSTPEQAYRVRVGLGETMTEDQIDLGLIIVEVAIAPAKPAEFVVFRFSHKRLSE